MTSYLQWGVQDARIGNVVEFDTEQEARDWMNPDVGNPNPGDWVLVCRLIENWRLPTPATFSFQETPTEAPHSGAPLRERGLWVMGQSRIWQYMEGAPNTTKKINAIKEARALGRWGLKEAKDAVEHAQTLLEESGMTAAEYLRIHGPKSPEEQAKDEAEAIASILQTDQSSHAHDA